MNIDIKEIDKCDINKKEQFHLSDETAQIEYFFEFEVFRARTGLFP